MTARPYLFLGPVRYVSHESEKPMRIVGELERPVPPEPRVAERIDALLSDAAKKDVSVLIFASRATFVAGENGIDAVGA
jgi:hypothetical protein